MSPRLKPVVLFALLLLLFPALGSVVRWWHGETLDTLDWLGVCLFPVLAWVWLRYFSLLACRRGCAAPE